MKTAQKISISLLALVLLLSAPAALAVDLGLGNSFGLPKDKSASDIIGYGIKFLLTITPVAALAVIIYGGFMYVMSVGDERKASHAKQIIIYGVIGLIIAGMSLAILKLVKDAIMTK